MWVRRIIGNAGEENMSKYILKGWGGIKAYKVNTYKGGVENLWGIPSPVDLAYVEWLINWSN